MRTQQLTKYFVPQKNRVLGFEYSKTSISTPVMFYSLFQDGTSSVVPQCYMLCPLVYGLFCYQLHVFFFVYKSKIEKR